MAFMMSRCLGLVTPDPGATMAFYVRHFGMTAVGDDAVELNAGPLSIFVDPGQPRPLVLELVTDDLVEARTQAKSMGFEELIWRGPNQSCLIRDPFGLVLNVHEDRNLFMPMDLEIPNESIFKSCVGAMTPSPYDVADFYSNVLETPFSRLPGGSYILDSGEVRLRFKKGTCTMPMIWLKSDAPIDKLGAGGCQVTDAGVLSDPFGLHWCFETAIAAPTAAVCPL